MRSKILVNPKWLFENYQKSNISILDSTWFMPNSGKSGHKDYIENRIPKAKFFDKNCKKSPVLILHRRQDRSVLLR